MSVHTYFRIGFIWFVCNATVYARDHYSIDLWFEDHTRLHAYNINELGNGFVNTCISIDTAVKPSGLCGLVDRTFVTKYSIRLRGLLGSQVRILTDTNFSHIFFEVQFVKSNLEERK